MIINHCLVCFSELMPQMGWTTLFSKEESRYMCTECYVKFEKIEGETCKSCDRPLAETEPQFKAGNRCLDCIRWEADHEWAGTLERNHSLVHYNDFAKEVISRYKYRGDYLLSYLFVPLIKKKLQLISFDTIVPIPLSEERLYERGFNQAEAIILACGYQPNNLLTRIHSEKQSKKSRSERIHLSQVFQTKINIPNKKILLIDDIYTTGSTLRHAAKVLIEAGAQSITSLTIARG
ncbi:ComF family protein [Cytobacillus praedii]